MKRNALPILFTKGVTGRASFITPSIFHLLPSPAFLHYHDVLELGVCLDGSGRYLSEAGEIPFSKGDVQVIPPYHPHYDIADRDGSLWTFLDVDLPRIGSAHISVDPAFCMTLSKRISKKGLYRQGEDPEVTETVCRIATLSQEGDGHRDAQDQIAALLISLMIELAKPETDEGGGFHPPKRTESILPAIHLASQAIERGEHLTPADLAAACFMSESYFRKLFSSVMGEPPKSYLVRLQIQRAAALLVTTSLSISEIAARAGFEDESTLYRRFVRAYGQAPSVYRQSVGQTVPIRMVGIQ